MKLHLLLQRNSLSDLQIPYTSYHLSFQLALLLHVFIRQWCPALNHVPIALCTRPVSRPPLAAPFGLKDLGLDPMVMASRLRLCHWHLHRQSPCRWYLECSALWHRRCSPPPSPICLLRLRPIPNYSAAILDSISPHHKYLLHHGALPELELPFFVLPGCR